MLSPTASAFDVGVAKEAGKTLAGHSAQRQRIDHQTLGIDAAGFYDGAGINAFVVETGVLAGTFGIGSAARLDERPLLCTQSNKIIIVGRCRCTNWDANGTDLQWRNHE